MTPFGDRAVRFAIPDGAPRRRLLRAIASLPGVVDVVLAERLGCVMLAERVGDPALSAHLARALDRACEAPEDDPGTRHVVEVTYDGEDLDDVARALGRTKDDVVALHSEPEYRVAMLGFLPGFAYLRGLPGELVLPRRAPRPRVPAGSVAIGAEYTGIYPFTSPGGWHLLGRARRFTPFDEAGAALAIGDVVRFSPSSEPEPLAAPRDVEPAPAPTGPHVEIARADGFALLVDGGRPGRMHEGVPPGGPLVRTAFARANALAGNVASACAVELAGAIEVVARNGPVVIADDAARVALGEGERHVVSTGARTRVRYLAVAGGVDAPVVLGGRGALLVAGVGRLLRRGDRLVPGDAAAAPDVPPAPAPLEGAIAIESGPDAVEGFSLERLTNADLRVAVASDRTGTRLEGLSLDLGRETLLRPSAPMVKGAIELTPSGPIVLGPDHPTTGGYPVVAVVRERSVDALFTRPVGAAVRFVVDD